MPTEEHLRRKTIEYYEMAIAHPMMFFETADCMETCFATINHIVGSEYNSIHSHKRFRRFKQENYGCREHGCVKTRRTEILNNENRAATEDELIKFFSDVWAHYILSTDGYALMSNSD